MKDGDSRQKIKTERKTKIGDFRVKRDEKNYVPLLDSWVPLALPTSDCLGATSCGH